MKVNRVSFVRFVYPFLFETDEFQRLIENIDTYQLDDLGNLWEKQTFPEKELLPHVARYLNPGESAFPTVRLWRVTPKVLQSPKGLGGGAKSSGTRWRLVRRKKNTDFLLENVRLTLFHSGVGFITVRVRPQVEDVAEWLDFLHYFRFLRRGGVSVKASRRVGVDKATNKPLWDDYFPQLAGGLPSDASEPRCFADVLDGLLGTAATSQAAGPWWSDVFIARQAIPYAVLFVDDAPQEEREQHTLLYKLHNFFHSGQGENPASEELRACQPHLLPYADRQWFVFSLEGGSFLACDPPETEFFRVTLPEHLDTEYLLLFLLTLQQRFALMGLSEQVTRHWLCEEHDGDDVAAADRREAVFRRIRDAQLSFTARGYFAQVMQRRHHHRCYLRWQETFQVERLFREVSDEVRDMHNYLQMDKTERIEELAEQEREQIRRTERTLNILAAFLLLPALVLSFLDAAGNASWWRACVGVAIGLGAGAILMMVLQRPWSTKTPPRA